MTVDKILEKKLPDRTQFHATAGLSYSATLHPNITSFAQIIAWQQHTQIPQCNTRKAHQAIAHNKQNEHMLLYRPVLNQKAAVADQHGFTDQSA